MTKELKFSLFNEKKTLILGRVISSCLSHGLLIFLKGELGAGKTTLVRGIILALGHKGTVKSPTYSLIEQYELNGLNLNHFDLYRFTDPNEWFLSGFHENINRRDINLIEWPEIAAEILPKPDLEIELQHIEKGRAVNIKSFNKKGNKCLEHLHSSS